MPEERTKLTAIRFPEGLLGELNSVVGYGKRSEFIVKATEKALVQLKQARALKEYSGVFSAEDYPEYATPERTSAWVKKLRREADERVKTLNE